MTPTENHAAMQLPFGANASRLAAFTGKLIDIAFHQSGTLESHLERRLQFLQGIAQGGPPAAELVEGCFLLHATTIYRIQIRAPQSEKSTPLSKMFSDDQARFALAGFRKELIAVSESQGQNWPEQARTARRSEGPDNSSSATSAYGRRRHAFDVLRPSVDDIAPSGPWMRCHVTNNVKALQVRGGARFYLTNSTPKQTMRTPKLGKAKPA